LKKVFEQLRKKIQTPQHHKQLTGAGARLWADARLREEAITGRKVEGDGVEDDAQAKMRY